MSTVIRRRAGTHDVRRDNGGESVHLLESGLVFHSMVDRILSGATAMKEGLATGRTLIPTLGVDIREDQERILLNTRDFIFEVLQGLAFDPSRPTPRARIVAAARTGKTIVMIRLVALTGLRTLVLAPSKTIVEKTVMEFRQKLPGVPVGSYYGDEKSIVDNGVTVATYQTLVAHQRAGILPRSITDVALVLTDEGHETMTELRQVALSAFDPHSFVIAFTATPDYNKEKSLAVFYPRLIDEMRIMEASQRGLLAPGRMRWKSLDVNASHVRLVRRGVEGDVDAKDYDEHELGRVMTHAVVFEACRQMRWDEKSDHPYLKDEEGRPIVIEHRHLKSLICCPSTEMAKELHAWLRENRPFGALAPNLVLGTTLTDRRRNIIADFKAGRVDTLICVRVLLRGFDEPGMKLLIDLSASVSMVLAEQKFCRPLTKVGDQAGIVAVLYPKGLRPPPILPIAVLGPSFVGDDTRDFLDEQRCHGLKQKLLAVDREASKEKPAKPIGPKIRKLRVKKLEFAYELNVVLRPPSFDPAKVEEVRAVLWSCPDFMCCLHSWDGSKPRRPTRLEFWRMLFDHETFVGWGLMLMRYCKIPSGTLEFIRWINRVVPEFEILSKDIDNQDSEFQDDPGDESSLTTEVLIPDMDIFPHPDFKLEEQIVGREFMRFIAARGSEGKLNFSERQQFVLHQHLIGLTYEEIGEQLGLADGQVKYICNRAISNLRKLIRWPFN